MITQRYIIKLSRLTAYTSLLLYTSLQAQTFTGSHLPVVVLETHGKAIVNEPKVNINMGIIDNPGAFNHLTDPYNGYDGIIGIETRGSSSSQFPKTNYGFETRDSADNNNNVPLMGLPRENDWIFYPPYNDKSLIRNPLTYHLARQMGYYAPRTKFCELKLNGDYRGLYILTERIKRDKYRVNIRSMEATDTAGINLTGGYIVKIDKGFTGKNGWTSAYKVNNRNINFIYHFPKLKNITPQQKSYISNYVKAFEAVLMSPNYADEELGYPSLIHVNSFIDYYLLNELSRNVDAYRISTYFYKNSHLYSSKLFMGPMWDYDLAFGNANYYDSWKTEGWVNSGIPTNDGWQIPFWWDRLLSDPAFSNNMNCRWKVFRETVFSEGQIFSAIDSMVNYMGSAIDRNFQRWPVLGTYVWPNYYIAPTHAAEIIWMKNWISERLKWMDDHMHGSCESTSIAEKRPEIPLMRLYPTPFTQSLFMLINTPIQSTGELQVYNIAGNLLHQERVFLDTGENIITWNGTSTTGDVVQPGVYLVTLSINGSAAVTQKAVKVNYPLH